MPGLNPEPFIPQPASHKAPNPYSREPEIPQPQNLHPTILKPQTPPTKESLNPGKLPNSALGKLQVPSTWTLPQRFGFLGFWGGGLGLWGVASGFVFRVQRPRASGFAVFCTGIAGLIGMEWSTLGHVEQNTNQEVKVPAQNASKPPPDTLQALTLHRKTCALNLER